MKPVDAAKLLNLHDSTLRRYSIDYSAYLSPSGAPVAGHHREYTDRDLQVLNYIQEMKSKRVTPEEIIETLEMMKDSDWARLPALDTATQSIVPTPGALVMASQRQSALQREIEVMQRDHEREVTMLREMLKDERADRDELLQRLHRAEYEAELYRTGRLKPSE